MSFTTLSTIGRRGLRMAAAVTIAVLALAQNASAQSCTDLGTAQAQLEVDKVRLVASDPSLVVLLLGCAAYAKSRPANEQLNALIVCGGFTCLVAGSRCLDLGLRAMEISEREDWIADKRRSLGGC